MQNSTRRWLALALPLLALLIVLPRSALAETRNVAGSVNGARVTAFSKQFDSRGYAAYAIDGKKSFNSYYTAWWVKNPNPTAPESITIAFDKPYRISSLNLFNDGQYGALQMSAWYSNDNVNWALLGTWSELDITSNRVDPNLRAFTPVTARYVRLAVKGLNPTWLQVCEFEVYGDDPPAPSRERRLTNDAAEQDYTSVFRDTVVWVDHRNGNEDIYAYDLKTGAERRITTNTARQTRPSVSGNLVVWEDYRNGNADVYSFNLKTGEESRITSSSASEMWPDISGSRLGFTTPGSPNNYLHAWDLLTGERRVLADDVDADFSVSGDCYAWVANGELTSPWTVATMDLRTNDLEYFGLSVGAYGADVNDHTTVAFTHEPSPGEIMWRNIRTDASDSVFTSAQQRDYPVSASISRGLILALLQPFSPPDPEDLGPDLWTIDTATKSWTRITDDFAGERGAAISGSTATWSDHTATGWDVVAYDLDVPTPRIETVEAIDFGEVGVGTEKTISLTVRNTGDAPLRLTSAELNRATPGVTVDAASLPLNIAEGASATVRVTYAPSSVGRSASAHLRLVSDDPDLPVLRIPVTGEGVVNRVNVAAASNGARIAGFSKQFDSRALASYAIDGKKNFNSYYSSWWVRNPTSEWVSIAFDKPYLISAVDLFNDGQYGAFEMRLSYSMDNVNWTQAGYWHALDVSAGKVNSNYRTFAPVTAKYVRVEVAGLDPGWLQVCEIEVFGSEAPAQPRLRRLTNDASNQDYPDVFRDTVVWTDARNGNDDIYALDLKTGNERRVTSNTARQTRPSISGDLVVWEDYRNGHSDIYSYDLRTGRESRLTSSVTNELRPDINGSRLAFAIANGSHEVIHAWDLITGERRVLSEQASNAHMLSVSGDCYAWVDDWDDDTGAVYPLWVADIRSGYRAIAAEGVYGADVSGQRVAGWDDGYTVWNSIPTGAPGGALAPLASEIRTIAARLSGTHALTLQCSDLYPEPTDIWLLDTTTRSWSRITSTEADQADERSPAISGSTAAWVQLFENGWDIVTYDTEVTVPRLEVSTDTVDFGEVAMGAEKSTTITVRNTGNAALTISSTEFAASVPGFRLLAGAGSTLTPGASAQVRVAFAPTQAGIVSTQLRIVSNDPDLPVVRIPLVGNGLISERNIAAQANGGRVVGFSRQFDSRALAAYAIDGKKAFNTTYSSWWVKGPSAVESLTIQLSETAALDRINLVTDGQYGPRYANVYTSIDGVSWRPQGGLKLDVTAGKPNDNPYALPQEPARYLRIEFSQPNDPGWMQVCEVEAYSKTP